MKLAPNCAPDGKPTSSRAVHRIVPPERVFLPMRAAVLRIKSGPRVKARDAWATEPAVQAGQTAAPPRSFPLRGQIGESHGIRRTLREYRRRRHDYRHFPRREWGVHRRLE